MKRILSLGAGVQSTTLLLMSCVGELERLDAAVFADTQAEIPQTYEHLDWLEAQSDIPVIRVTAGSLREAVLSDNGRTLVPVYFFNDDTMEQGRTRQKCTHDFKTVPKERWLKAYIREQTGCGRVLPTEPVIEHWFGYSIDEWRRAQRRGLGEGWEELRYPLIEKRMARWDCLDWLRDHGFPEPPRSACDFCPNRSNEGWRWIRSLENGAWENALAVDQALRDIRGAGIDHARDGEGFIHSGMRPLGNTDLSSDDERQGQMSFGFGGCDTGECGT